MVVEGLEYSGHYEGEVVSYNTLSLLLVMFLQLLHATIIKLLL